MNVKTKGTATMESNNCFLIFSFARLLVSLMSFPPLHTTFFFSSYLPLVLFCFLLPTILLMFLLSLLFIFPYLFFLFFRLFHPTILLMFLLSLLFIFPYLFFLFFRLFQSANSEYWHVIAMVFISVH